MSDIDSNPRLRERFRGSEALARIDTPATAEAEQPKYDVIGGGSHPTLRRRDPR